MPTIQNEEIMAIRNTLTFLNKRLAIEPFEGKRQRLKKDINELENILVDKLNETSDFKDVQIEEDVY